MKWAKNKMAQKRFGRRRQPQVASSTIHAASRVAMKVSVRIETQTERLGEMQKHKILFWVTK